MQHNNTVTQNITAAAPGFTITAVPMCTSTASAVGSGAIQVHINDTFIFHAGNWGPVMRQQCILSNNRDFLQTNN